MRRVSRLAVAGAATRRRCELGSAGMMILALQFVHVQLGCTTTRTKTRRTPVFEMRRATVGEKEVVEKRQIKVGERTVVRKRRVRVGYKEIVSDGVETGRFEPVYAERDVAVVEPVTEDRDIVVGKRLVYEWKKVRVGEYEDEYRVKETSGMTAVFVILLVVVGALALAVAAAGGLAPGT